MNHAQATLVDHHLAEARRLTRTSWPTIDDRKAKAFTSFRLSRLIEKAADDTGLQDGVEFEAAQEWAREAELPFDSRQFALPWSVLAQRDLNVASPSGGGYLNGTDMLDPIDLLRPWSVTARAGITILDGLKGNTIIPKTTGTVSRYWVSDEATALTPSAPTVGQVALVPKTAGALVKFSRLATLQIASVEAYLRRELLRSMTTTIDAAVLAGTGSAQPIGIVNTVGVGTTSGTSLGQAGVTAMVQAAAEADTEDDAIAFLTTPAVRKLLQNRERASGSGMVWNAGQVADKPGFVSTTVPSATAICGYWPACILGLWGTGVQIAVTRDEPGLFAKGTIQLRVFASLDVCVTTPAAFNVASSVS